MTCRSVRIFSTALLTAALVLTGCGTSDKPSGDAAPSTKEPTSSGAPSSTSTTGAVTLPGGKVTSRSGDYTVTAPAGWGDATDQTSIDVPGLDLLLLSSSRVSKFSNNLVVITKAGDAAAVASELEKGRTLTASADREMGDADDVQIAGVTAKGFTTKFEQKGVRITARSYAMTHAGKVYLLTLSSSQDDAANALSAFGEIADSWTWS